MKKNTIHTALVWYQFVLTHLAWFLADLDPVEATVLRFVNYDTLAIKTEDVVADTARPTWLHLVFVSEQFLAGVTAPIIQLRMRQNSEQCALAGINVSYYGHPTKTLSLYK